MSGSSLYFVGNATVLIRHDGFAFLTDPNYLHRGQRAYLGRGLWSKRRTEPASRIADLPPLDGVILSHMHGDHWDRVARRELPRRTTIVTTPHAARHLAVQGFTERRPLRTWDSTEFRTGDASVALTAMPGRHGPAGIARLLPPVMGSMLEFRRGGELSLRLYISGDTLMFAGLRDIAGRYPAIDVGLLHLGGTALPGGITVTMDARQGADVMDLLNPRVTVPIHYDDYGRFRSSLADFRAEAARRGRVRDVAVIPRGREVSLPSLLDGSA